MWIRYEDEELARRFDLLVLNMELVSLESDPKLTRYQQRIRELASGLQEKKSIPVVTEADIAALESILFSDQGPGSKEDYLETYSTDQPLGKLFRQVVGLDMSAAKEAFNEFLSGGNFTARPDHVH